MCPPVRHHETHRRGTRFKNCKCNFSEGQWFPCSDCTIQHNEAMEQGKKCKCLPCSLSYQTGAFG